ncbi:MAG TPA: DivIVA domain-containing protein [Candidatus Faecousia gallistercoris]|nr:DivIVA domain-containing protein [Candidatus Faecousia faecigallinarum]HIT27949.1 DivIVA domain-containing protein [Candidatus Faecousia gallistercoris]
MFTPQQLEQISFDKAVFGGYDMQSVDEFLEPLLEDYETLYKENATLKSKMRVLVEKLEEYRQNEGSVQAALQAAQKTCDNMVRQAEAKCLAMLRQSEAGAGQQTLANARATVLEGVESLESKVQEILDKLSALKAEASAAPAPKAESEDQVAREIAENLEKLVGTTTDEAPVTPPPHRTESGTSRFTNLQFGKNYDPTKR